MPFSVNDSFGFGGSGPWFGLVSYGTSSRYTLYSADQTGGRLINTIYFANFNYYQHLLEGAKQRATSDQASLAENEKKAQAEPNGDGLVQVGAAYLSYGQTEKAIAAVNQGIAKGNLKYPDEANLLIGIAQLRAHDNAAAQKAFEKVATSSNQSYARL